MRTHKRNKRSRLRGRKTAGYGYRKKHKGGKGETGGRGMAGTGKRAGHKIMWVFKYAPDYFGKRGFASIKKIKIKLNVINLDEIEEKIPKFLEKGIAKKTNEGIEVNLLRYKVLGRGNLQTKIILKAFGVSSEAKKKIEATGGKVIIKASE